MTDAPARSSSGGSGGRKPTRKRLRQRTGPGPRDPVRAGSIISEKLSIPGLGEKLTEYNIRKSWEAAVGRSVARHARPERLIKGALHVTVSSAPWMNELNYQKSSIMEAINRLVSKAAVSSIVFRTGRITEPPKKAPEGAGEAPKPIPAERLRMIEDTVFSIEDPALREAVRKAMLRAAESED